MSLLALKGKLRAHGLPARRNLFLPPTPQRPEGRAAWFVGGKNADVLTWELTNTGWSYGPAGQYAAHLDSTSRIVPQGLLSTVTTGQVTLLETPYISAYTNPPNQFSVAAVSTQGWPVPTTPFGTCEFSITQPDGSQLRNVTYTGISGNTFTGCSLAVFQTTVTYPAGSTISSPGCHTGVGVNALQTVPGREYAFIGRTRIDRLANCLWVPGPSPGTEGGPTGPPQNIVAGGFPTLIYGYFEPFPPNVLGETHDPPITTLGAHTWVMRRTAPPGVTLMIGVFGFGDGLWPDSGEQIEVWTAGWQLEDVTGMPPLTPQNVDDLLPYGDGDTPGWGWEGTPGASISQRKSGVLRVLKAINGA